MPLWEWVALMPVAVEEAERILQKMRANIKTK
jgi:hypothetical protein